MSIEIVEQRPDSSDALELLEGLDAELQAQPYPRESRHAFSVEKLIRENVAFFLARWKGRPAGCGGVKMFGTEYGEVKRMFVRPSVRGLGIGKAVLNRLEKHVRERKTPLLRLETGIHQVEAIGLYERFGFVRRPPFGDYQEDPNSVYFEKSIA